MTPQQEAFEAAKLATAIGSQLKSVDQLSYRDSSSMPANRININEFINCINNPNARVLNKFNNVPAGFAPPPSEDYIQSAIPYVPQFNQPQQMTPVDTPPLPSVVQLPPIQQPQVIQESRPTHTEIKSQNVSLNDFGEIKKSLEQINKTLIRLVDVIKNKK